MKIFLDHIGIACNDLDEASKFWKLLNLTQGVDETVESQGVKIRFFSTDSQDPKAPRIELLEPTSSNTPVGKFIANRGVGVQQLCFRVENLEAVISLLVSEGIKMIDEKPRSGAHDTKIAFVHPHSTGGVLVELVQA